MRLNEVGLTLRDVDLGGIDAESDPKLHEDFVTTRFVESAIESEQTLFLGRKGSGKSAVFSQLPRLLSEHGREIDVVQITPDQYAWAALKQYKEDGLLPEQAHTNAWKLTLAIEAISHLSTSGRDWSEPVLEHVTRLRAFVRENFGDLNPSLTETASAVMKQLQGFNLQAFGFGVGFERDRSVAPQAATPQLVEALLGGVAEVVGECGLILEMDRLDDSWDGSEESQSLLIGLLKAAKSINDSFGRLDGDRGLRVLIFLRSDIYDVLRFDDKDKHRTTEEHLIWDEESLKELLSRRLPDDVGADDLFEAGTMRGSPPFNHIINRTFMRPRELIQFVELAKNIAGADSPEIGKRDIRAAEEQYSTWKVEDLKQEYRRAEPHFEPLLECLRQELHRYEALEELQALLERKLPTVADEIGGRRMLEILFNTSVVGIRLGGGGKTRFKSNDPNLVLPSSGLVYVHQSLHKGLNIKEARRPRGDGEVDVDVDDAYAGSDEEETD